MRAVIAERFGSPWRIGERQNPNPGPSDVLVKVEASGVCYTDVHQLHDHAYGGTFPRIPGHEPVGNVVAIGSGVTDITIGDRVGVAYTQRWCGHCRYCMHGRYEHCVACSYTGITVDGGHAEFMLMDAGSVEKLPAGMDPVTAAPVFCAGFTVYSGICDAELRPGERCAVIGVGGLGHLAIQYASALGAEVVAVTRSADKRGMLHELGAQHILVTGNAGAGEELRRIGGVDVMLNTANGVDPALLQGLRPYGRISLLGGSRQTMQITPTEMLFGKFHLMGSSQGPRHRLREVLELHVRSNARTFVEDYALNDAGRAYDRVVSGSVRFRAVLVP